MHPVVNHLVQLQELILIRDEQRVASSGKRLETLEASIRGLTEQLPREVRVLFEKLYQKDRIAIAPLAADGGCAVCGMKLPISLVQAVRMAREIQTCPQCAHMLYDTQAVPRHVKKAPRRSEPRKAGIARFSAEELMVPQLQAEDQEGAIRELAAKMEECGFVDNAEKLVEAALRREAILSTAVEHGLAFPHVRGVEGGGLTLALGISRKGIRFGEDGDGLTRFVFLIVIPTAASAFYLKLLAGLAETFAQAEVRKAVMAEKEPEKMWKALVKATRSAIK
jgi:mannitol/fructose-specific phosphotransferase system IIA component (Ntr-type)